MVEYTCERCLKVFNKKSTYVNHTKRKYKCILKLNPNDSRNDSNYETVKHKKVYKLTGSNNESVSFLF